jgi:putative ABC transport system permease protein
MLATLFGAMLLQGAALPPPALHRTIAIDERLAQDAGIRVGELVVVAPGAGAAGGDTMRVAAIVRRGADPSEVARSEYTARLHLTDLQRLIAYGDRVDRFAIATRDSAATARTVSRINGAAFGFRAHPSADIAVETSKTFAVISRFHKAIVMITIVASAIFLLCIMLLKVDERRRDIAALRLIGVSRASVARAVVIEATLLATVGSLVGALIGWATSIAVNVHYQAMYRTPLKFAIVTGDIVVAAVALSIVLGVGAGALAAWRLVRTPPLALLGR